MHRFITIGKVTGALLLGLAVLAVSSGVAQSLSMTSAGSSAAWVMPMLTHLFMLIISLLCILILSWGRPGLFGFTLRLPRWTLKSLGLGLGIGLLSNAIMVAMNVDVDILQGYSTIAIVLLVWGWASLSEEVLCRGLLQSLLARILNQEVEHRAVESNAPIVLAALFFTFMHLPLIMLGVPPGALVVIMSAAFLLGLIAGYVRRRTGSIVPAVLVHAVFNISGSLTDWWVR